MSDDMGARLLARGLRMAPDDIAPLAELVAMLDAAAEALRAPLPPSAEPASVLVLSSERPVRPLGLEPRTPGSEG